MLPAFFIFGDVLADNVKIKHAHNDAPVALRQLLQ